MIKNIVIAGTLMMLPLVATPVKTAQAHEAHHGNDRHKVLVIDNRYHKGGHHKEHSHRAYHRHDAPKRYHRYHHKASYNYWPFVVLFDSGRDKHHDKHYKSHRKHHVSYKTRY